MKKQLLLLILALAGFFHVGFAQSGHFLVLDGDGDYMDIENSSGVVGIPDKSDFTITCWVKIDPSSTLKRIISNRSGVGNSAFEMITGSQLRLYRSKLAGIGFTLLSLGSNRCG